MDIHFKIAASLSKLLDEQFKILGFKFGIDPLLDFIPIAGSMISLLLSLYILWIGHRMKLPDKAIRQMWRNIIFDFLIGTIPIVGQAADFVFKANTKNMKILHEHVKNGKVMEGEIISDSRRASVI